MFSEESDLARISHNSSPEGTLEPGVEARMAFRPVEGRHKNSAFCAAPRRGGLLFVPQPRVPSPHAGFGHPGLRSKVPSGQKTVRNPG